MPAPETQREPRLCLIVARAKNGVIGRDGDLPWRLRDDMAFFKKTTTGHPIIMGRKTWESFPKRPLPNRLNILLTRNSDYEAPGALVFSDIDAAIAVARARARQAGDTQVFVIGGAEIYRQSLSRADRLYLTEIDAEIEGDAVFPSIDEADWTEVSAETFAADERNNYKFTIRCLDRVQDNADA